MISKTKREWLLEKYPEKDVDYILKLEDYASELDDRFDDDKKSINFDELFNYIKEVQEQTDIDQRIHTYAEYLKGIAIPFFDSAVKEENLEKVDEFDLITENKTKDWVTLIKRLDKIDYDDFNKRIKVNGSLVEYFEKSNYQWALGYGVWHHYQIKKYRNKLIIQAFEKIRNKDG